jgi:hypothetical protein
MRATPRADGLVGRQGRRFRLSRWLVAAIAGIVFIPAPTNAIAKPRPLVTKPGGGVSWLRARSCTGLLSPNDFKDATEATPPVNYKDEAAKLGTPNPSVLADTECGFDNPAKDSLGNPLYPNATGTIRLSIVTVSAWQAAPKQNLTLIAGQEPPGTVSVGIPNATHAFILVAGENGEVQVDNATADIQENQDRGLTAAMKKVAAELKAAARP